MLGIQELAVIGAIILAVTMGDKAPDAAKSVGRSVKEAKDAMKDFTK